MRAKQHAGARPAPHRSGSGGDFLSRLRAITVVNDRNERFSSRRVEATNPSRPGAPRWCGGEAGVATGNRLLPSFLLSRAREWTRALKSGTISSLRFI